MSGLDSIAKLHAVVAAVAHVDGPLAAWLDAAIDAAEGGEALEAALGLSTRWRHLVACRRRDDAIREIRASLFATVGARAFARVLLSRRDLLCRIPTGPVARITFDVIRRALAHETPTATAPCGLAQSRHDRTRNGKTDEAQRAECGREV